ncbi:ABC transporter ATP-binding protein [Flavisphingomonas formosensis]|uniref:ABC transporter ATP-binding protein n=1 Tax=Flavisphingomonas formosensis TaxID=861534 RepID=UPI0012FC369D|nr:ABC transporter ATP-binding protein [Sphingomonas formosensis]
MTTGPIHPQRDSNARLRNAVRGFLGHILRFERGRLARMILLSTAGAIAEAAGLMLLLPLLHLLGISDRSAARYFGIAFTLEAGLVLYLAIIVAAALVMRSRTIATIALRIRLVDDFRRDLHAALLKMSWTGFQRLQGTTVTHVMTMEVSRLGSAVDCLTQLATAGVLIPLLLAVAIGLSPAMTLLTLLIAGAITLLSLPLNRQAFTLGQATGEAMRDLHASIVDDVSGLRLIKSFGAEEERQRRFDRRQEAARTRQLAFVASTATSNAAIRTAGAICAVLGLVVAVRLFAMGLAAAVVFVAAFGRLMMAALRIQESWRRLLNALPGFVAVDEMLALCRAEAEPHQATFPVAGAPGLRLLSVSAQHGTGHSPALHGVSVTIPAGRITAVVGPSGAGKSTLADIVLGLAEPISGHIYVGDLPLTEENRAGWRRHVGYVPQDAFLFCESIAGNLRIASPSARDEQLWTALNRAGAAEVVRRLPEGLDTIVGDRGSRLSGGERQRLTIARALLRNPSMLVLDEPTSGLDEENERGVLQTLAGLRNRVTILLITHRPSTLRHADHIIVMDEGRAVDGVPPPELAHSAALPSP